MSHLADVSLTEICNWCRSDLLFARCCCLGPSPDWSPTDILEMILEDVHPSPQLRFREEGSDADELRYASWYAETDEGRQQWGLYAYTVRRGSYVQAALLTDEPADLDWALNTWRSLRSNRKQPERDRRRPHRMRQNQMVTPRPGGTRAAGDPSQQSEASPPCRAESGAACCLRPHIAAAGVRRDIVAAEVRRDIAAAGVRRGLLLPSAAPPGSDMDQGGPSGGWAGVEQHRRTGPLQLAERGDDAPRVAAGHRLSVDRRDPPVYP
jgi:hypothetical protein